MKKLRLLLLVMVLCLLTGCSSVNNDDDDDDDSSSRRKNKKQTEESVDDDDEGKGSKKNPSAEDLINGINAQFDGTAEYVDIDVTLNLDALIDGSALGSEGMQMTMKLTADLNMEQDKDTQHTSGNMHMEMLGMIFDQKQDEYKQLDGDMWQVYEYDSDTDSWSTYSEAKEDNDTDMTGGMTELTADYFEDLKVEKDGDTYVVTGTIPYQKIADSMDLMDSVGDLAGGSEDALKDCYFDVTMVFDKKSKELKSMDYSIKNLNAEGTEINDFTIGMKIKQIGGDKEVTVPNDVIEAAESSYGGFGGDDFGFGGSETPKDIASTGSYDVNSFMKKISGIAGLEEDDWHTYNSDYGYTSVSAGMYDYTKGWSLYFDFTVYDPANDDYFTAESNFEDMGGENYKEYLEEYKAEGNEVKGAYKADCALWYVDGGEYDTYYVAIDGNTILKITGYVNNYSGEATPEKFNEMYDTLEQIVTQMGFPQ